MATTEVRYRSHRHPGDVPAPVAFGGLVAKPIAATMTPVMVVGLIMVLQGIDPLPFVVWAAPFALGVAAIWTWYRMRSVIVEIVVTQNGAAALTIVESLLRSRRLRFQRVFDVRSNASGLQVTIGRATYRLDSEDWPTAEAMARDLASAKSFYD